MMQDEAAEPDIAEAQALVNDAIATSQGADPAAALEKFDAVIRQLEGSRSLALSNLLGAALYNRSATLRFARRTDDAVKGFDALADRFQASHEPLLRFWVALARYNKAFALLDAGRREAALDAFQDYLRQFKTDQEPKIRERAANAMHQAGLLLRDLGRAEDAKAEFLELLRVFGNAPEPSVQQIVARLIANAEGYVDLDLPAAHAFADRMNLQMAAEYEQQIRSDPEHADVYRQSLDQLRTLIDHDVARAAALHHDAVAIIKAHRERLEPFALFLRNFDFEEAQYTGAGPEGEQLLDISSGPSQRIETVLGASLKARLPMVGIANPRLNRPDYKHAFPKLAIRNEVWRAMLQELVSGASLIVVQLTDLTPGVMTELQTILWHRQQNATVIIRSEPEADSLDTAIKQFYAVAAAEPATNAQIEEALQSFPHTISERDLPSDDITAAPVFVEILRRASFVQSLAVAQRQARRRIMALTNAASEDLARGLRRDAIARLEAAHSMNAAVNDRWLTLRVASMLGAAHHGEGNNSAALGAFGDAAGAARALDMPIEEGLFLKDQGRVHRALGDNAGAIRVYLQAIEVLNGAGSDEALGVMRELGSTYLAEDDGERAIPCFEPVLAALNEAGVKPLAMELSLQLGTAYFKAKRYEDAVAPFESALALARELRESGAEDLSQGMLDKTRALAAR